ncbi:MAG: RNA polymerase sigma factor [bacterium]|nr:RNA polymerase sigma factor [bacterium]
MSAVEDLTGDSLDDAELVRAIVKTGDEDLFATLVHRHKNSVFRIVSAVFGPFFEAETEELTQEVFIQVYLKLDSFRHQCAFSTWLFRLARNLAIDRRRRARWRLPHFGDEALQMLKDDGMDADPEDRAATQQRRRLLIAGLETLNETQRMAVLLYYWFDCRVIEIARLMDLNTQTVKSHLHRARLRLARRLGEEFGDG